jgi:hypothetical protein
MSDEITTTNEEVVSFSWWLCMLPFLVAGGVCVYKWMVNRADSHWLMYAIGALIIGLVFTAVVAGAGSASRSTDESTASGGTGSGSSSTTTTTSSTTSSTIDAAPKPEEKA